MPSPKSGNPGTADTPTDPTLAKEADDATPGDVTSATASPQSTTGNPQGSQTIGSSSDNSSSQNTKLVWISIELRDKQGHPVPGEGYEIDLPDGTTRSGNLDDKGKAREDGIIPGQCKVRFPRLHNTEWKRIG
jgi:hypothetical protein